MNKPFSEFRKGFHEQINPTELDHPGFGKLVSAITQQNLHILEQYHNQYVLPLLEKQGIADHQDEEK